MMIEQNSKNSATSERSTTAVALDNLIRRKLRVSDPRDPREIAQALRGIYVGESEAIRLEAEGVPFIRTVEIPTDCTSTNLATHAEQEQATEDVERDLTHLTNHALLKDVKSELNGWAFSIRAAVTEGTNAARFALDPWQRDRAMASRRLLSDYARVSRYVGALTPNLSLPYRQLAKSLDEVASVILVLMGDALANVGYSGGRFLLQAPASELQERRDAVIYALRNLTGSTQEGYGPNDWPRGLLAYRQFLNRLEESGQADLRALFQENNIARIMDDLIHLSTSGTADDLRALGATATLALGRFHRLIRLGNRLVDPESPPLAAYLSAIQLFLDAFSNGASGYRLLYISRPPITFYGLYGVGGPDTATQRLIDLIIARGRLAEQLDCYLGCECGPDQVRCQLMLDKILYDVDRAIDLYALGTDPDGEGEPEQRAAAYGVVIQSLLDLVLRTCFDDTPGLRNILVATRNFLLYPGNISEFGTIELQRLHQELCIQRDTEAEWENLLSTMAPFCLHSNGVLGPIEELINDAISDIENLDSNIEECPEFGVDIPAHHETSLESIADRRGRDGTRNRG